MLDSHLDAPKMNYGNFHAYIAKSIIHLLNGDIQAAISELGGDDAAEEVIFIKCIFDIAKGDVEAIIEEYINNNKLEYYFSITQTG